MSNIRRVPKKIMKSLSVTVIGSECRPYFRQYKSALNLICGLFIRLRSRVTVVGIAIGYGLDE
jgi:hypothetical protein